MAKSKRICPGSPTCPAILTGPQRYCPTHMAEREQRRGTSSKRGYGNRHQKLRAHWQGRIDAGEVVKCWRPGCGRRIVGTAWHLGHDDDDRRIYKGPECVACNLSAGGRKGGSRLR